MRKKLMLAAMAVSVFGLTACGGTSETEAPAADTELQNEDAGEASVSVETEENVDDFGETMELQILATSDMHGKFLAYDYALNQESTSGSVAQIATAVKELRTDHTLVLDAGDIFQDNSAEIFLEDDMHPMSIAMNAVGYDGWTTGNHEYNYGMESLEKRIEQINAPLIVGNVYCPDGTRLGEPYHIYEVGDVKVGVIGMVTPNIARWDALNLKGWKVTDVVEETRKAIEEIQDETDVLIALDHMSVENEYDVPNSGVEDLANACPELNLIIASHGHQGISDLVINGVPIVENKNSGQTLAKTIIKLEKGSEGDWSVSDTTSELIPISDYEEDPELVEELSSYNERAIENAEVVIGEMLSDYLAAPNEIAEIPTAQIEDTALIDFINEVQMHYADAQVSATELLSIDANLYKGDIHRCDMARIYKYTNTLYKLEMTGYQLKKWMEWSAQYYNTLGEDDLTISFNEDIRMYNYDMFSGVNYEINIANEPGNRIENLTWPDGTPVEDDDVFVAATSNYRAASHLSSYGSIFTEGEELPKILEIDVRGDIGGIRELLADYITNECDGKLTATVDNNWKLTGIHWDEELHQKVMDMLTSGELTIPSSADGRTPNVKSITVSDLK